MSEARHDPIRTRKTPDELRLLADRVGFDGAKLTRVSRLVAKVDSAAGEERL